MVIGFFGAHSVQGKDRKIGSSVYWLKYMELLPDNNLMHFFISLDATQKL